MITFPNKQFLQFIELISEQRDLYDPNSPYYKSKNKRAKIWEGIATKCNKKRLTGNTCKNLWNKLKRSYVRFKKNGSVVTKRTFAKSKVFELMTFLDVKKQKGNEKKPQGNENQQQSNENQQQGNKTPQQSKENQQHGNENPQKSKETQQEGNENPQQSKENQQQGNENQQLGNENLQQDNEKNLGPKNKNAVKKQHGIQNKSTEKSAPSDSSNALQYAMPSVQLNISGVEVNLGPKNNEETPQSFHENFPAAKPKPQSWPQQRQNEDTSTGDELGLFSTQVRTILVNLPCELQIRAQEEVFQVLTKYKKLALLSMSVSESSSTNTE